MIWQRLLTFFKRVFKVFFYGNIFMAVCGIVWTMVTPLQTGFSILGVNGALLGLVFFGVLLIYNAARSAIFGQSLEGYTGKGQSGWAARKTLIIVILLVFSVTGIIGNLFYLEVKNLWPLGIAGLLVLAYYGPFSKKVKWRLRNSGMLKNLVIGIVWALVTVLLPLTVMEVDWQQFDVLLLGIERTIFIFTIMLPFDLTDVDEDRKAGIETLPYYWGIRKTKFVIFLLTFALAGIVILHYDGMMLVTQLLSLVYILMLIPFLKKNRGDIHFLAFWDGAIFLQGAFILGSVLWQLS